jgi:hypothetical protein
MQRHRSGERGSASLKFLIVMVLLVACAYSGYLYVPVAFHANTYKDLMQHYVDVAATQGYPPSWAADQLRTNAPEYDIPDDAIFTPAMQENRMAMRVQYVHPIVFPGYTYNYEFDYTVKSTAFLSFK